jgi:hypothetical protein
MAAIEIWKDIKDYEGLYEVSNKGRVKSLKWGKERILKPGINRGYHRVLLQKNGKRKFFLVNRLVYQAFKGDLIKGLVIDHINNIPSQNHIENLQQISHRENITKGILNKNTSSKYPGVGWYNATNKWVSKIRINGKNKHLGYFESELAAAQAYEQTLKTI